MPRPQSPEGRRNNVCAKLSDDELAAVNAARGSMIISEWLRLVILAAAERGRPPASRSGRETEAVAAEGGCPHRLAAGAYCKTCQAVKS